MTRSQVIPRHWLYAPLAVAFAAALVLVSAFTAPGVGAQDDEGTPEAAEVGVLGTPTAVTDCAAFSADPANAPSVVYQVDSAASEARYVAQEELRGVGDVEAVGRTNAIVGTVSLDADGVPMTCSRIDVDLRTLASDESRRDNYLQGNTLETQTYPLATFVLTSVEGMDGPLAEGEETTVTLVGELTLRDVTNVVAWEADVTLEEGVITGTAATEFDMPEFGIEPPVVGPVVSLDERLVLEFDLTLRQV